MLNLLSFTILFTVFAIALHSLALWVVGLPQSVLWASPSTSQSTSEPMVEPGPIRVARFFSDFLIDRIFSRTSAGVSVALVGAMGLASVVGWCLFALSDTGSALALRVLLSAHLATAFVTATYVAANAQRDFPPQPCPDDYYPVDEIKSLIDRMVDRNHLDYLLLLLAGLPSEQASRYLSTYLQAPELDASVINKIEKHLLDLENVPHLRYSNSHLTARLYSDLQNHRITTHAENVQQPDYHQLLLEIVGSPSGRVKLWARDLGHRLIACLYWAIIAPAYSLVLLTHWVVTRDLDRRSQFFTTVRMGQNGTNFAYFRLHRAHAAGVTRGGLRTTLAHLLDSVNLQTPGIVNVMAGHMNLLGPLPLFHVQYAFLSKRGGGYLSPLSPSCEEEAAPYQRLLLKPGVVSTAMIHAAWDALLGKVRERGSLRCCEFAAADIECVKETLSWSAPRVIARDGWLLCRAIFLSLAFSTRLILTDLYETPRSRAFIKKMLPRVQSLNSGLIAELLRLDAEDVESEWRALSWFEQWHVLRQLRHLTAGHRVWCEYSVEP